MAPGLRHTEEAISSTSGRHFSVSSARPMRASANSELTASRDWLTSAEARCISAAIDADGFGSAAGGAGSEGAGRSLRDERAAASRRGATPAAAGSTSQPFTTSIQTSVTELARNFSRSAVSRRMNLVRQKGWSSHAPHMACRCMPSRSSSTGIFFSMERLRPSVPSCLSIGPHRDDLSTPERRKPLETSGFLHGRKAIQRKRDSGTVFRSVGSEAM